MTDIPADIATTAREAAAEWDRMNWSEYEGNWHEDMAASFAAAILAERERCANATSMIAQAITGERERCAKMAASWEATARKLARQESDPDLRLYHDIGGDMASDIASAIRSPERAGE